MTEIITPLAPHNAEHFAKLTAAAREQGADMVELRLDQAIAVDAVADELLAAIAQLPLPVVVTCRHPGEGGDWQGTEAERLELLLRADQAGAAFIDVELQAVEHLPRWPQQAKLILSYHDFSGMSEDVGERLQRMYAHGADIAKVALTPSDGGDLAAIENLCQRFSEQPLIAIAMGPFGAPSRYLAGAWGCSHTFARLAEDESGSAPGQPTIHELTIDYRLREQTRDSLIFGVIGNPIGHSLSPAIHNAALAHDGIDAIYVPFLVDNAQAFWRRCHGFIDGLSITIPHKQALLAETSSNEPLAQAIAAINTLYRDDQGLVIGANTDAQAALECVAAVQGEVRGARCLILGAGGVARAISFALHQAGAQVTICNRTPERAAQLATAIGCASCPWEQSTQQDYDVLVNATAVGMNEEQSPWPMAAHRQGSAVFDTVYTPLETKLLCEAEMQGCRCQDGLRMFIKQAAAQYQRWLGRPAPELVMHRVALERLTNATRHTPGCHSEDNNEGDSADAEARE